MPAPPGQILLRRPGKDVDVFYTPLEHQQRFHASTAPNCIMSGGAGTGKSLSIRMDAYLRCMLVPRFRAVILRREMPELRRSHLDQVPFEAERLGLPREAFHTTNHILRFPNGSWVLFDHVNDDAALTKYLSSEFEAIYFDELATFTLKQFKFLASRARTTIPGLTPIVRGGTNPVGVGASWVRKYFVTKTVTEEEDPSYQAADYENIHSTIDDNPHIDLKLYEKRLLGFPSDALRRAMRHGEWVTEGQFFSDWEPTLDGRPWHVRDTMPLYRGKPIQYAEHIEIVRVIDWGFSASGNPGMCVWFACLPDDSAIGFQEYVFRETLPADVAAEIKRRSEGLRVRYTVGDTAMWAEHSGPSIAEQFARAKLGMVEADKVRPAGWIEVHRWLRETVDDGTGPRPRLSFLAEGCPTVIRTFPDMVVNPKDPTDLVTTDVEDEGVDVTRYFVMSRPGKSRQPAPAVPSPEFAQMQRSIAKIKRRARFRVGTEATREWWRRT